MKYKILQKQVINYNLKHYSFLKFEKDKPKMHQQSKKVCHKYHGIFFLLCSLKILLSMKSVGVIMTFSFLFHIAVLTFTSYIPWLSFLPSDLSPLPR